VGWDKLLFHEQYVNGVYIKENAVFKNMFTVLEYSTPGPLQMGRLTTRLIITY